MTRTITLIVVMFCVTLPINAENGSLLGTVKKTGAATGLSGVNVRLANIPSLSAITDAEGKFRIGGKASIQTPPKQVPSFQFNLKGDCILFSPVSGNIDGRMDLFSSSGRKIFSTGLASRPGEQRSITLPELSSGINFMRITMGATTLTRTLVRVGNQLYLEDGVSETSPVGNFSLRKQATATAAVDTLVASKSGFTTKKVPIDSYTKENITIEIDSAGGTVGKCTREALQELVNGYIAALEAADPAKMSASADATYTENLKISTMGDGIWKTKIKVNFHRDFFDVDSCKIYTEVVDNLSSPPYNIGAQIKVTDGKISEVSALVATTGDWLLSKASDFTNLYNKTKGENWDILPVEKRDTRAVIQAAGDAYLDCFDDSTKVQVPWGIPCARLEGGSYTGDGPNSTCNVGVPQGLSITARIYIVDVEMGTVDIFCKFGGSMPDSHLFRVQSGKLRYVHTISIQN